MRSMRLGIVGAALALASSGFGGAAVEEREVQSVPFQRGKKKPKFKGRNVLRGYFTRYSNVMSFMSAEKNQLIQRDRVLRNKEKRERRAGK